MTDIRCANCAHSSTNTALLEIPRAAYRFQGHIHRDNAMIQCFRWIHSGSIHANDRNIGCFIDRTDFDLVAYYRLPPSADPRDDARDADDDISPEDRQMLRKQMFHRLTGWGA